MSNRDLPMMPWYPDQFAASTSDWTNAERYAYRTLLDRQWQLGVLPDDPPRLARAIGITTLELRKIWPVVGPKFHKVPGGLQNERLEEHRRRALDLKEKKQLGAKATNEKLGRGSVRSASRSPIRSASRIAGRQRDARAASRQRDATLHSSHTSDKTDPKMKNLPPSQGSTSGAAKPPRKAQNLRTVVKALAAEKSLNGGHESSTPEPTLGEKVRTLAQAGNGAGDIVKLLAQHHLTAEQVERCLAGGEP